MNGKPKDVVDWNEIRDQVSKRNAELASWEMIAELHTGGGYFATYKLFFLVLEPTEGLILSFLYDIRKYHLDQSIKKKTKFDEWFPCSVNRILRQFRRLSKATQHRVINNLKKRRYVESKVIGFKRKRMFKINHSIIRSDYMDALEQD